MIGLRKFRLVSADARRRGTRDEFLSICVIITPDCKHKLPHIERSNFKRLNYQYCFSAVICFENLPQMNFYLLIVLSLARVTNVTPGLSDGSEKVLSPSAADAIGSKSQDTSASGQGKLNCLNTVS